MLTSSNSGKVLLILSLVTFLFYLTGFVIIKDVYKYPLVGAIYEMLWLPMLILLALIPVISLISLFRNTPWPKYYAIGSMIFIAGAAIILIIK